MATNGVVFRTPRLYVKKFASGDVKAYAALEGNAAVMRYISGRPRTFSESKKRFVGFVRNYKQSPHTGVWGVFEKGSKVYKGTASLNPLPNSPYLQIGYKLHPGIQNKGYATEIARHLLRQAFMKAKLRKVTAVTDPANTASQRVLHKAGLQRNGFHPAYGTACTYFCLEHEQYFEGLRKRR